MLGVRTNPSADNLIHATHANPSPAKIKGSSIKTGMVIGVSGSYNGTTVQKSYHTCPNYRLIRLSFFKKETRNSLNADC